MSTQKKNKIDENPIMGFLLISRPKMMITYHLIIISALLIIGIRTLYRSKMTKEWKGETVYAGKLLGSLL